MTYETHIHVNTHEWRTKQTVSSDFTTLPATAEEHGCRPLRCTAHWERVVVGTKQVRVEVTIDEHNIVQQLAKTAAHNRTGRAREYDGLLSARVVKERAR